jgi:hypothetical protein
VKDALDENGLRVVAGAEAPEVATCPACGGVVNLRHRRDGAESEDGTWFYRHRRGEGPDCPRRTGSRR